ncbi:hypothetical protein D9M69_502070 [compost metagenome]
MRSLLGGRQLLYGLETHAHQQLVDASERAAWPTGQQECQGFRQPQREERQGQQRRNTTVEEDGTPTQRGDNLCRDDSAHGGAQGIGGGLQADGQSAPFLVRVLPGDDVAARQDAADT